METLTATYFKDSKNLLELEHKLKMERLSYERESERIHHEHEMERQRIKTAEIRKHDMRKFGEGYKY